MPTISTWFLAAKEGISPNRGKVPLCRPKVTFNRRVSGFLPGRGKQGLVRETSGVGSRSTGSGRTEQTSLKWDARSGSQGRPHRVWSIPDPSPASGRYPLGAQLYCGFLALLGLAGRLAQFKPSLRGKLFRSLIHIFRSLIRKLARNMLYPLTPQFFPPCGNAEYSSPEKPTPIWGSSRRLRLLMSREPGGV